MFGINLELIQIVKAQEMNLVPLQFLDFRLDIYFIS